MMLTFWAPVFAVKPLPPLPLSPLSPLFPFPLPSSALQVCQQTTNGTPCCYCSFLTHFHYSFQNHRITYVPGFDYLSETSSDFPCTTKRDEASRTTFPNVQARRSEPYLFSKRPNDEPSNCNHQDPPSRSGPEESKHCYPTVFSHPPPPPPKKKKKTQPI